MAGDEYDELVVGAGVTGLTTALLLARGARRVAVVTAEPVGGGSSGRSAGIVSQLHGSAYRRLAGETARRNAAAYRAMNAAGFDLIAELLAESGTPHERRDAVLVALRPGGARLIDDEHLAAHRAGLRLEKRQRLDLPFAHHGALRLPDQVLVDPGRLLTALAVAARNAGAEIVERERVIDVDVRRGHVRVETGAGERSAARLVLATGTPVLDRGLYALKTQPFRIMAVVGTTPDASLPMTTALGPGAVSTTVATGADGRLVGIGAAHPVGTDGPESRHLAALEAQVRGLVPGFERVGSWSGQDYRPFNPIAFVGALPRGLGSVTFATGYDGWGLTQGAAAGIRIAGDLLGRPRPRWATTIGRRVTRPPSMVIGARADLRAAATRVGSLRRIAPADLALLADGQGLVHRTDEGAVATSLIDGVVSSVTASCSRCGGRVAWNDVELGWDCPVCGSRFSPQGEVVEGAARGRLRPASGVPRDGSPI
ncbi:FAD-dependent oxidoreductase [Amnibacterium endophyticum]|uniref:FAD-dependent oxidoreductase n=1 Tax=Amnibacterium endophyticum TaxID=2109337 RepID=A0ABW4LIV5_9MICO